MLTTLKIPSILRVGKEVPNETPEASQKDS